jgi:glycosyltransferase involved in cell wall biosynthesis
MLKIAYIVPSLIQRGPIIFTNNIINGLLDDPSVQMEVFYLRNEQGLHFGVPSHLLTLKNFHRLFEFDILHSTQFIPDLLVALLPIARKRKVSGMLNFLEEDLGYRYSKAIVWPVSKVYFWALRRFKGIIYYSKTMNDYYHPKLNNLNAITIDPGIADPEPGTIDPEDLPLFDELRARKLKIIGTVCMINKRKGLDQVVRSLEIMPDCAFVVVGEGAEGNFLNTLAVDLGVKDRFHIIGFRDKSYRYNTQFDVYAMVSRSEGFGLALLEAMRSGIPVVCSRLPVYSESMGENDIAFFEVDDIPDLVSTIRKVLKAPTPWIEATQDIFNKRFSSAVMCRHHLDYYQKCLLQT